MTPDSAYAIALPIAFLNAFASDEPCALTTGLEIPRIGEMKKEFDSSEHGGAPLLGISKPVIKAHGSSDAKAIKNAVRQAISFVKTGINQEIFSFAKDYEEKKILAEAEKMYYSN